MKKPVHNFQQRKTFSSRVKFQDFTEQRMLHRAYFFCKDDKLTQANMKIGTLEVARKTCADLYTPDICHNKTEAKLLEDMIIRAEILNPG